jgi:hypothetical protein
MANRGERLVKISLSLQTFGHAFNRAVAGTPGCQNFQGPAFPKENADVPKWNPEPA